MLANFTSVKLFVRQTSQVGQNKASSTQGGRAVSAVTDFTDNLHQPLTYPSLKWLRTVTIRHSLISFLRTFRP